MDEDGSLVQVPVLQDVNQLVSDVRHMMRQLKDEPRRQNVAERQATRVLVNLSVFRQVFRGGPGPTKHQDERPVLTVYLKPVVYIGLGFQLKPEVLEVTSRCLGVQRSKASKVTL